MGTVSKRACALVERVGKVGEVLELGKAAAKCWSFQERPRAKAKEERVKLVRLEKAWAIVARMSWQSGRGGGTSRLVSTLGFCGF